MKRLLSGIAKNARAYCICYACRTCLREGNQPFKRFSSIAIQRPNSPPTCLRYPVPHLATQRNSMRFLRSVVILLPLLTVALAQNPRRHAVGAARLSRLRSRKKSRRTTALRLPQTLPQGCGPAHASLRRHLRRNLHRRSHQAGPVRLLDASTMHRRFRFIPTTKPKPAPYPRSTPNT